MRKLRPLVAAGAAMSVAVAIAASAATATVAAAPAAAASFPQYDHVFLILDENLSYSQVIGSPDAPEINALAADYGVATHYTGVGDLASERNLIEAMPCLPVERAQTCARASTETVRSYSQYG
jgi:hypothetical protein